MRAVVDRPADLVEDPAVVGDVGEELDPPRRGVDVAARADIDRRCSGGRPAGTRCSPSRGARRRASARGLHRESRASRPRGRRPAGTSPVMRSQAQSNTLPQWVPGRSGRNAVRSRTSNGTGSAERTISACRRATGVYTRRRMRMSRRYSRGCCTGRPRSHDANPAIHALPAGCGQPRTPVAPVRIGCESTARGRQSMSGRAARIRSSAARCPMRWLTRRRRAARGGRPRPGRSR